MSKSSRHAPRKDDHIFFSLQPGSQFASKTTWLEYVELVHNALPEIDLSQVSLTSELLGFKLRAPLLIAGMTGGTNLAKKLNKMFAMAAEELGVALGVGSQRVALEAPEVTETFSIVREAAVSVPVIANIGASQLVEGLSSSTIELLIDMVDADAIAVHLNPLQEALQIEGDAKYAGLTKQLEHLVKQSPVPVIVKETGAGVSREVAEILATMGIYGVDVGGAGGTSFSRIEGVRALIKGERMLLQLSEDFAEWGIPTAASIIEVRNASGKLTIVATGGLRNGVDAAKALRLGADTCGFAYPVLRAAFEGGYQGVLNYVRRVMEGLRRALFLTGARNIEEIRKVPVVIGGKLREWVEYRGLKLP